MKRLMIRIEQNPILSYTVSILLAFFQAFNYRIFILPNQFAPSGINGIATMIEYLSGLNIGYLALLANIPLLILAYFYKNHRFAVRTMSHIVAFSLASILFGQIDFSAFAFTAHDSGESIMAAVAAGIMNGAIYSVMIRINGSTGGMDIVAALVTEKKPEFNMMWVIFTMNLIIAIVAFFVYGMSYRPVILSIIYSFVTSRIGDVILKGRRVAIKFEIITPHGEELAKELMEKLRHGCTLLHGKGMYSGEEKDVLICVVNRRQAVDFENIVKKYENTFIIVSGASETLGNFKEIK